MIKALRLIHNEIIKNHIESESVKRDINDMKPHQITWIVYK